MRNAESRFAASIRRLGVGRAQPGGSPRKPALSATNRGSGAFAIARRSLLAVAATCLLGLVLTSAASASLGVVGTFPFKPVPFSCDTCGEHPAGGDDEPEVFSSAAATTVNANGTGGASPGDVYVADPAGTGFTKPGGFGQYGPRIQQFTSKDSFVRLWGPDVVSAGPDNSNEVQGVRVDATGGFFKLSFGAETTTEISATATPGQVQSALNALHAIGAGGVTVGGGPGNAGGTSPYVVTFSGGSLAGENQPQLVASNGATPLSGAAATATVYTTNPGGTGFEICRPANGDTCKTGESNAPAYGGSLSTSQSTDIAASQVTGNLYVNDLNRVNEFSATGQFIRAWGWDVVAAGPGDSSADERQQLTVEADGGSFTLSYGGKTTTSILWNAPASGAGSVEAALNELSSIGGNQSSVTVTGGPGDHEGTNPYVITFHGLLGGDNLSAITSSTTSLSRTGGGQQASITTLVDGGSFEVCTTNDLCKEGGGFFESSSGMAGAVGSAQSIAVAPAGAPNEGDVLVFQSHRVQEFTAAGAFVRLFGGGVVIGGATGTGDLTAGSNIVTSATTTSKAFSVGQTITSGGGEIPTGTTIAGVGAGTITLSKAATASASGVALTVAAGAGNVATNEQQTLTLGSGVTSGNFKLKFTTPSPSNTSQVTGNIPFNATVAQVQTALEGLSNIGAGNTVVTLNAGGDPGGGATRGGPWTVEFTGKFADTNVESLVRENGSPNLNVSGSSGLAIATTQEGAAPFEVCTVAESCQRGVEGAAASAVGLFGAPDRLALAEDSTGAIYTVEGRVSGSGFGSDPFNLRAQKFTPAGGQNLTPALFGTTEIQTLTVNATGGQFRLGLYEEEGTTGTGSLPKGGTTITGVVTNVGTFAVGQPITSGDQSIPYGTYITAIGSGTITISQPRQFFSGSISIRSSRLLTTSDLAYNATAAQVQTAVNGLSQISSGGGSVTVTGGPAGTAPLEIAFNGGRLVRSDAPQLIGANGGTPLSGGSGPGANQASIVTTTPGGPNGAGVSTSPLDVAVGAGNTVFISKNYPGSSAACIEGRLPPPEIRVEEFSSSGAALGTSEPCDGIRPSSRPSSLAANPTSGGAYLLEWSDTFNGRPANLFVFGPVGSPPALTLDSELSEISSSGATISGTINPHGPGEGYPGASGIPNSYRTTYRVEYKKSADSTWTKFSPDAPFGSGTSPLPFSVGVSGLTPKTGYDLKVVASKPFTPSGTVEATKSFTTLGAPPTIISYHSSGVAVDSADLHAQVNSQGTDTTYHFEYGTTTDYGSSTPDVDIGESHETQTLQAHIEGLQDTTYHFRVVATNSFGTTRSEDQTFVFHAPSCPNQTVRQQTNASYLPDCRAYELVSPENAGGATLYTGGPQRPYATSPSRLAFVAAFGQIPNTGDRHPIDSIGDLYVATRGASGWTTRYIGLSSNEAGCMGGRPIKNPWGNSSSIQNDVFATPSLDRLIDWNLGNPGVCIRPQFGALGFGDFNTAAIGSNAPYLWNADGQQLGRWPTSVADIPGATENFACPQEGHEIPVFIACKTMVSASGDLNHFVFSTQSGIFGQGGLTSAPGSAYDNDTVRNTLKLISLMPDGTSPIPQEPSGAAGPNELIQFPHVSTDGSRILMGTATKPACSRTDFQLAPCPVITQPTHLYMRVNDAVTYDVSADYNGVGQPVTYVGSTEDGAKVFFTTNKQMTADDTDESVDLYMWDENGGSPKLTRISAGANGTGNTDNCAAAWTHLCNVKTFDNSGISDVLGNRGGLGGWQHEDHNPGYSDNSSAAKSGDIYFYSPEQLVPGTGLPAKENVYVYRHGSLHFVAALNENPYCIEVKEAFVPGTGGACSKGSLGRLQVTDDGAYAAFITTSRITSFDNAGHSEMYRYNANTGQVLCVSCNPDGSTPTSEVFGSMGGRFVTDDGRVFFDTEEALEPRDSNLSRDTYEFVDGRPQLITTGTGGNKQQIGLIEGSVPGFYGVSADGTDAYFGTLDTLVGQDQNGSGQLKFYDARVGGGFSFNPPAPPCQAADECHGPSSQAPASIADGTGASLSGGNHNAVKAKHRKKHRKHHRRQGRGARAAQHKRGGTR